MELDYIIVQAGGRGSRMQSLTENKPKALVPVNNLPMIFHLFHLFPNKKFIIIGDYKYDVLNKYLKVFANVNYKTIKATGYEGTCAGLKLAIKLIPNNKRFILIWCDLVLPKTYKIPVTNQNVIGISKDFPCRWSYKNGKFLEERSSTYGVAGFFIFKNKGELANIPLNGEFVRWLSEKHISFYEQPLTKTHEYGLIEEWNKLPQTRCRPFNEIKIKGNKLYKMPLDKQGLELSKKEIAWYKEIKNDPEILTPHIYSYSPLCMQKIDGHNIYEYTNIPLKLKKEIVDKIISTLKRLHNKKQVPLDIDSYYNAYIDKTFDRINKIKNLVPFANQEYITINNKKCKNIFFYSKRLLKKMIEQYMPTKFCLIHGDCTFSNILLQKDNTPVLIDPRGYFGHTKLYGDPAYDWAKLYYSLYSNYDQFNLKKFALHISNEKVTLSINSNNWEDAENVFFKLIGKEINKRQMKLFLALIWLSLTTYSWEDYDSICGAFYNGIYYLEESMHE